MCVCVTHVCGCARSSAGISDFWVRVCVLHLYGGMWNARLERSSQWMMLDRVCVCALMYYANRMQSQSRLLLCAQTECVRAGSAAAAYSAVSSLRKVWF